jgi:hypothetical protein
VYARLFRLTALPLLLGCFSVSSRAVAQTVPQGSTPAAQPRSDAATGPANELDAFMAQVLARREVNRKTLEQYVLDETEGFEILGPGRMPLYRTKREFTWYVRDAMHVRSPVRFNGVAIDEPARVRYETRWIARERERLERAARKSEDRGDSGEKEGAVSVSPDGIEVGGTVVPAEPRFVSEAYFMDFKFEPGNYYLAGREQIEGHDVLRIEYYPTRMFGDDRHGERKGRDREAEENIERRMNKTALITLWVDPKEHQIVRYTFDNVWLDFLPGGWLVRVDDIRASMLMGQPFPGVWLPRNLTVHSGVTLASGSFEASYERRFSEYRLAEVATKIRIPKQSSLGRPRPETVRLLQVSGVRPAVAREARRRDDIEAEDDARYADRIESAADRAGQVALRARPHGGTPDWNRLDIGRQSSPEVITEIRVHGNAFITDAEVLGLAGIAVGQQLDAGGVEAIAQRLEDSERFETVDVRKRYRSLTGTGEVAIVLLVHEKPGAGSSIGPGGIPGMPGSGARRPGRLRSTLMFLPIVGFEDGYGFTYGVRTSTVNLLGAGERLSLPVTWGGTRRAALELERQFKGGPLTRVDSGFGIWNRENPRFGIRDQRVEVKGGAERVFRDVLRLRLDMSRSTISFGDLDDRLWTIGTSAAVDTRLDPAFPSNGVLLAGGWTRMHFREVPRPIDRFTAEARGYVRLYRQAVLAARTRYTGADATLPPYERLLLGGSSSLRGFRAGSFDGDRMISASLEARVPLTSVLNGSRVGLTAFIDAGTVWDAGRSMDAAEWHRGVGAGLFLIASIVRINLDVARGLKTGDTRVHLSSGFTF